MIIAVLALTLAFTTPALANGPDKENPTNTEFKFIGNVENQPVFELNLINSDDEYTVTFRDQSGNVLYTDKYKGAAGLTKKFLLKTEDFGDVAVNVVVKSKKNGTSEVYTINRSQSDVEETVINKIK
jgi:hypothetical protein